MASLKVSKASLDAPLNSKQTFMRKYFETRTGVLDVKHMAALGRDELDIDFATIQPASLECLMTLFEGCSTFKVVRCSDHSRRGRPRGKNGGTKSQMDKAKIACMLRGISFSKQLECIDFDYLPPLLCRRLPKSLANCSATLRSFKLNHVNLGDDVLHEIVRALMSSNITDWKFASCNLTETSGQYLRDLIKIHGHKRENKRWQYGLRGDLLDVLEDGVLRLDVSGNKLGDDGLAFIGEALEEDEFLFALDLSSNSITSAGVDNLLSCLADNSSLANVVIDENAAVSVESLDRLQEKLEWNLQNARDPRLIARYSLGRISMPLVTKPTKGQNFQSNVTTKKTYKRKNVKEEALSKHVQLTTSVRLDVGETEDVINSVDDVLARVDMEVNAHLEARIAAEKRVAQLERENTQLKADIDRHKSRRALSNQKKSLALENMSSDERDECNGHELSNEDFEKLSELTRYLEGFFRRMDLYLEKAEMNKFDAEGSKQFEHQREVVESKAFFKEVAQQMENMWR